MAIITWKVAYSVKIAEFDRHHQRLIELINALHDAMLEKRAHDILGKLLDELIDYTKIHFNAEEAAMLKYGYPNLTAHKKSHESFVTEVLQFQQDFQSGKLMLSIPVLNFLRDWLVKHIQGEDTLYADFFTAKGMQ